MAFAGIEVAARIKVRIERSVGWYVDWPLIETKEDIMIFSSDIYVPGESKNLQYVDIVRQAYSEMRKVVADRVACSIGDANSIVAAALDIRNCALYGLGNFVQKDGKKLTQLDNDIAVIGVLPKSIFPEILSRLLEIAFREIRCVERIFVYRMDGLKGFIPFRASFAGVFYAMNLKA